MNKSCYSSDFERFHVRLWILSALARCLRTADPGLRPEGVRGGPQGVRLPGQPRPRDRPERSDLLHHRTQSHHQEESLLHCKLICHARMIPILKVG